MAPERHQRQQLQRQSSASQPREIAIFWDYENVPLPEWCNAAAAAKAIVDAVSSYGRIVDRRLYYDFERHRTSSWSQSTRKTASFGPRDSSGLDSCGFDLVNTPTRNQKETLDKKLIADALTFAWDSAVRNDDTKPCVVLLTSDGDYAYTLSKLRDRGVMTVVMVGKNCTVASILVDTADVALSLERDVLSPKKPQQLEQLGGTTTTPDRRTTSWTSDNSKLQQQTGQRMSLSLSSQSEDQTEFLITSLCRIVQERQSHSYDEEGWVDFGSVSSPLQEILRRESSCNTVEQTKEKSKEIRKLAESRKLIESGRRVLEQRDGIGYTNSRSGYNNTNRIVATYMDPSMKYSSELYVRLLRQGLSFLEQKSSAANYNNDKQYLSPTSSTGRSCVVFIGKLPPGTHVRSLVDFLERSHPVTVRRALLEPCRPPLNSNMRYSGSWNAAHVEFLQPDHATLMVHKANKTAGGTGIIYSGRSIGVVIDGRASALGKKGSEEIYYEREVPEPGMVSSRSSSNTNTSPVSHPPDETSNDDKAWICVSIHSLALDLNAWIRGASVRHAFHSILRKHGLENTSNEEEINVRFNNAKDAAIMDELIELGRRRIDRAQNDSSDNDEYVAVPFSGASPTKPDVQLSSEYYLRLLPFGLGLARKSHPAAHSGSSPDKGQQPRTNNVTNDDPSIAQSCLFLSNLSPQTHMAAQLADFFDTTFHCQPERIELEQGNFKGSMCISAHVQFATSQDASTVLQQGRTYGLIYQGRRLFIAPDRTTPDRVASKKYITRSLEMSYTRVVRPEKVPLNTTSDTSSQQRLFRRQEDCISGNTSFDTAPSETNTPDPQTNPSQNPVSPSEEDPLNSPNQQVPILTPRKDSFEGPLW